MNQGIVTGGIVSEAVAAWTPRTAEAPSRRRVTFSISARDSRGGSGYWKCEAEEDDKLMDFLLAHGATGTGVKLEFELCSRPFLKHGVQAGESRFLRVRAAEINGVRVPAELFAGNANPVTGSNERLGSEMPAVLQTGDRK